MGWQAVCENIQHSVIEWNICTKVNTFCQCEPYNFHKEANYHDPGSVVSVKAELNRTYTCGRNVFFQEYISAVSQLSVKTVG